jgi:hypothetical protein
MILIPVDVFDVLEVHVLGNTIWDVEWVSGQPGIRILVPAKEIIDPISVLLAAVDNVAVAVVVVAEVVSEYLVLELIGHIAEPVVTVAVVASCEWE